MKPVTTVTAPRGTGKSSIEWPGSALRLPAATWLSSMALICALIVLGTIALEHPRPERTATFLGSIGLVAAWRYGWWLTHALRASYYLRRRFPAIRARADALAPDRRFQHVYAVVLSYDIAPALFRSVYDGLLREAITYGAPTTIVASITSERDRALLKEVYLAAGAPPTVEIVTQYQEGTGKRTAMGEALRIVSRRCPPGNSALVLMDGDILLEEGALTRSLAIMSADPRLGAVTTNNDAIVEGSYLTRQWYFTRYAQRHLLMASMSLSERLLVLTGRFSIFRATLATEPEFIDLVERDGVDHWRYGRLDFVSGDDKSTWFHAIRSGARMLYIPDVKVYGAEALPAGDGFFRGSTRLMQRWFGNMLRANGRAIALGPRRLGLFTWWALVDQRLSMWTSLIGPYSAVTFALLVSPVYLAYYALWVLTTRIFMSVAIGVAYRRFSPAWPFVLYYNQIWGALLKVYLSFRLNRQGWTRQNLGAGPDKDRLDIWAARAMHAAALVSAMFFVAVASGQLPVPGASDWKFLLAFGAR
ncbi:MAG: glycosyltransferase [Rhodobacteraceae bacterium]|nr:glycosyltransferase [Paracoccaceae bacterium]